MLPAHRDIGAGKALMRALANAAVARGCGRMEWAVLDWNKPAIHFYAKIGARLQRQWVLTRLDRDELRRLARRALHGNERDSSSLRSSE